MEKYLNRFIQDLGEEHSRLKSWEFIYGYVHCNRRKLLNKDHHEKTALHLAYYLASWGMFRGGGPILYKNLEYFKELSVLLFEGIPRDFPMFYKRQFIHFDCPDFQIEFDEVVRKLRKESGINPTDVLVSKILLGIWGEVPALDRYFKIGHKILVDKHTLDFPSGRRGIGLSGKSMGNLLFLCKSEGWDAKFTKIKFKYNNKVFLYPLAKKIDMALWQYGLKNS